MSIMSLTVDFVCGTKIEDACKEMIILANKLNVNIKVGFNDIIIIARPGNDSAKLVKEYFRVQKAENELKMVMIL